MNDDRNDTEYSCVIVSSTVSQPTITNIIDESDTTILYVAGEYQYSLLYITVKCYLVYCSRNPSITYIATWQDHFLN